MSKKRQTPNGFDEAVRHYKNARELLARCRVEDGLYEDIKPVQEAFGTAWLAIDKALKAALQQEGLTRKQLPKSWDPLLAAAVRRLAVHNGKLAKLLSTAYEVIHIGGYYHGEMWLPGSAKDAFDLARRVIETLSNRKIG